MDTQKQTEHHCSKCGCKMENDKCGRPCCGKCNKNTPPKELYEEAFFDLKEYKK